MPGYLIIGAAKCGTTSLYNYLVQHPAVFPCFKKEVHYFDYYHRKGEKWYRSHFPLAAEVKKREAAAGQTCVTGESSPYYLAHPLSPQRVKALLPEVRMICMLRNPVDRAISSYYNQVRLGIEPLKDFETAIEREEERIRGHEERLRSDPSYSSFAHKYFSYVRRGCYAGQLENWYRHFPKEQILVIQSESFYADPAPYFRAVVKFIGLNAWEPPVYKVFNAGGEYEKMPEDLRRRLLDFYRPHNERLFQLTGQHFEGWDQ
ncbi:MAG: sulfotransferase [Bacteroidia bacterium]|nr:sulfotransferase [Bacteroidia bacterium]